MIELSFVYVSILTTCSTYSLRHQQIYEEERASGKRPGITLAQYTHLRWNAGITNYSELRRSILSVTENICKP